MPGDATVPDRGRWVELAGCHNLRDLGGYRGWDGAVVRRGAVYRSDALGRVDEPHLRRALDDLGIRTTIDLRGEDERERQGFVGPHLPGRHLHISALDQTANAAASTIVAATEAMASATDIGELYLSMVRRGAPSFARSLEVIADADGHAVAFFCSAGKDRTGILAALVLGLLGVADEDIVADYALTETVADAIEARAVAENPRIVELVWSKLPPGVSRAWPTSMARFLELVRGEHGDVEGLATAMGVPAATVGRLRTALLV
jgi:protein-tyrosine phosphatase